jgi:hypothetical protein
MTAEELIREVVAVGGKLVLRGDRIAYELPKDATSILAELKDRQPATVAAQKLSPDDFGTPTGSGDSR